MLPIRDGFRDVKLIFWDFFFSFSGFEGFVCLFDWALFWFFWPRIKISWRYLFRRLQLALSFTRLQLQKIDTREILPSAMAQFGGQKNPPWATQFTATAVSQPGQFTLDVWTLTSSRFGDSILGYALQSGTMLTNLSEIYLSGLTRDFFPHNRDFKTRCLKLVVCWFCLLFGFLEGCE